MKELVRFCTTALVVIMLAVIGCSVPEVIPPGRSGLENPSWWVEPADVEMKAGETASVNIVLDTLKGSGEFSYTICRVKNAHVPYYQNIGVSPQDRLPMPKGLEVSIEPSQFRASPYKTYHALVTIRTTPEVPADEYIFFLEQRWDQVGTGGQCLAVNIM